MACCVLGDDLLVRIDPGEVEDACREPHVTTFGTEGRRPMRGFVAVSSEGLADDAELARWVGSGAARAGSLPPK